MSDGWLENPDEIPAQVTDDERAGWERRLERDPNISSEAVGADERIPREHRDDFEAMERLAAPLRQALTAEGTPPDLDEYESLTEISRGGMGIVYRGRHRKMQRVDAIKVLRTDRFEHLPPDARSLLTSQFLRESQLAARVAHEHIVPVYHVGESLGQPWFSMQYVEGCSLHQLATSEGISTEHIVRYVIQIARAIDAVHRHGILHGDIKPQNILIERLTDRPMISDFGLADWDALLPNNPNLGIAGTPAYLAPELAEAALNGSRPGNHTAARSVASDIYSLGVTLWESLTGEPPCDVRQSVRAQLEAVRDGRLRLHSDTSADLPKPLQRIIARCVARHPLERYASARELADALLDWVERPLWNQHFPGLRSLLCLAIAPVLLTSSILVQWMASVQAPLIWFWITLFGGYLPLFATFWASYRNDPAARQAKRELWSIWAGHLCVSAMGFAIISWQNPGEIADMLRRFYPFWALVSALVFFAKSGNFWSGYRWVATFWLLLALPLAHSTWSPVLFGLAATSTCFVIAIADRSFQKCQVLSGQ